MSIQYLPYKDINIDKWDACIAAADNGLVYGYAYYLNAMAKQWDALVLNDYEAVMPLTFNKKYGIHYLYQPFFTACLGVFGHSISADLVNEFLLAIPTKFKYWDIYLNHGNHFILNDFEPYQRMNYVLPLNESSEIIYKNFRDNIKRNIKKAAQLNCVTKKNIAVEEIIALAKAQSKKFSPVDDETYARLKSLCQLMQQKKQAITYGIYNPGNELLASAAFFFSHKRAYYILVGNHPNGKTIGASHALINAFIQDYAGQNLVLDFEGSDIRNLAFFYSSFGAVEEKYIGIKVNRLPAIVKLLKP
jgi:hypothetical protein